MSKRLCTGAPPHWINQLLEVLKCPICLNTLRPPTVLCVNGHGICKICKTEKERNKCPVCLEDFARMNSNSLLLQTLEVVGLLFCKFCRRPLDGSHRAVCGDRPTSCKLCEWTGKGRELPGHVTTQHSDRQLLEEEVTRHIAWPGFVDQESFKAATLIHVACVFFWHEINFQPLNEILTITFHPVATGNKCDQLEAIVVFKYIQNGYVAKVALTMDPDAKPSSILVPISVVQSVIAESKELKYDLRIKKVDV